MTDRYVYYFMSSSEPRGAAIRSTHRATLDAIKGKGEAAMESQLVVDHREVDDSGFVIDGTGNASYPSDPRWAQIRSLELRANSRDIDARGLDENSHGAGKYMLELESRELRQQAEKLKQAMTGPMADNCDDAGDAQSPATAAGDSRTG